MKGALLHPFNELENRPVWLHRALAIITLSARFLSRIIHAFSGQQDSSLAPNGSKQAQLLGRRLASESVVTHVYSSDLVRAKEVRKVTL